MHGDSQPWRCHCILSSMESREPPKRMQFSLTALLISVICIGAVIGLIIKLPRMLRRSHMQTASRRLIDDISISLEKYRADQGGYPPDTIPSTSSSGSDILFKYLWQSKNAMMKRYWYPPHFHFLPDEVGQKMRTAYGSSYEYRILVDKEGKEYGFILVDPGPDQLLGGRLEAGKGFVPNNSDENGDGVPDHNDNLIADKHHR